MRSSIFSSKFRNAVFSLYLIELVLVALERTCSEKKGGGFNSIIVNKKTVFTALTVTKFIVIIMMNLFFYRKSIPNVRSKGSLFHYQTGPFAKTCTYVSLPRSFM